MSSKVQHLDSQSLIVTESKTMGISKPLMPSQPHPSSVSSPDHSSQVISSAIHSLPQNSPSNSPSNSASFSVSPSSHVSSQYCTLSSPSIPSQSCLSALSISNTQKITPCSSSSNISNISNLSKVCRFSPTSPVSDKKPIKKTRIVGSKMSLFDIKDEMALSEVIQTLSEMVQDCDRMEMVMAQTQYYRELMHFRAQANTLIPTLKHHAATYNLIPKDVSVASIEEDDVIYEGWLMKKSHMNRHKWKSRYFVLRKTSSNPLPGSRRRSMVETNGFSLTYYDSQDDAIKDKKAHEILIEEIKYCQIAASGKGSVHGLRFNIFLQSGRKFELQATKAAIARTWETNIVTCIAKLQTMKQLKRLKIKTIKEHNSAILIEQESMTNLKKSESITTSTKTSNVAFLTTTCTFDIESKRERADQIAGSLTIVFKINRPLGFTYSGLTVKDVQSRSQAKRAGVKAGWCIGSINQIQIRSEKEVSKAIAHSIENQEDITIVFLFHNILVRDVIFEGWLKKKSSQNRHLWQPRFFILNKTGKILYFPSIQEAHARKNQRMIKCSNIRRTEIATKGKGSETRCRLNLHTKQNGRIYELITETNENCRQWQYYINQSIKKIKDEKSSKS